MTESESKKFNPDSSRENRYGAEVSREQAIQLMGGEEKLQRILVKNTQKTFQELRKFPVGGTRLCVEFTDEGDTVYKILTSERQHEGKDIDRLLRALDKYDTPVEGPSWEGFTDPELDEQL
jgi:hypothetical protein